MRRGQKTWVTLTIWIIVIGFAAGGILFFTPGGPQGLFSGTTNPQENEPAIVVNGETITQSELEAAYQSTLLRYRQLYQRFGGDFDEQLQGASGGHYRLQLRNQAANSLIRGVLLNQEASERGISVPQTQIDLKFRERYQQFLTTNGVTEEQLLGYLENPQVRERFRQFFNLKTGTLSEFKDKLRAEAEEELKQEKLKKEVVGAVEPPVEELLDYVERNKQQYLSQIIAPVVPTDEELQGYFDEHRNEYAPEEVRARHILIKVPQDAAQEAVQSASRRIQEIHQQLQNGADFAELARQHSEDPRTRDAGGDLGWFTRGQSPYGQRFAETAFSLKKDQVSPPVRTDAGFHLIRLEARRQPTFEDVKEEVKQDYIDEIEDERFQEWLEGARERGTFPELEEVRARHILIKVPQDAAQEAVQSASRRIQEIHQQLQNGADFAELARQHSEDTSNAGQGGDLGWFGHGKMVPTFDQVAFSLEEGQISEPFRSQFGFHIVKLEGKRTTDALEQQVREAYIQEQTDKRFEDWVQDVEGEAEIEVKDALLAAYRLEEQANQAEEPEEKLDLLDEAVDAYGKARRELVSDPYIGYYQSRIYLQKIELLKGQLDELGEDASAEERSQLQARLEQNRRRAAERFLDSVGSYTRRDDAEFQEVVTAAPQNAQLRYYYARFLADTLDAPERAMEQIGKALELDPDYWEAHLLAAEVKMRASDYEAAIGHLQSAEAAAPSGSQDRQEIRLELARAHLERARLGVQREESLVQAEQILSALRNELDESSRNRSEALALLGDVYMEQQNYEGAQDAYQEALKAGGSRAMTIEIKLGRAYLAAGELKEARQTFDGVTSRPAGQYSVEAHIGLGDVYRAEGDAEKALESYRKAMQLRADNPTKIGVSEKIVALAPEDLEARLELATLYGEEGRYSRAIEQYNEILRRDSSYWRAQQGLGDAYLSLSEYAKAVEHYKSALLEEPPTAQQVRLYESILEAERGAAGGPQAELGEEGKEALLKLAELYLKQGREDRAREQLATLEDQYPDYRPERVKELKGELEGGETDNSE